MSGAEAALRAARLGDEVVHGFGLMGMVAGALIGAAIGLAIVAAGVATGGLAIVAIVGGCIAGGGLAGGALARGIMKAADLPGPTTGTLASAGPSRVTVNSRMALRAGMDFSVGCSGAPMNHFVMPGPVLIAEGSQTVTINGKPMARQSMRLACGAKIKGGSGDVTVGGPTVCVVDITDYEEMFETGLQALGYVALGAAGLGAVIAGVGATLVFGGIVAGSMLGMEALHSWGESLGPGYGDIMVGVAGFALLAAGPRMARSGRTRKALNELDPDGAIPRDRAAISRLSEKGEIEAARDVLKPVVDDGNVQGVIDRLDVTSPKDGGYLWSGDKGAAKAISAERGGVSLETTKGGKVVDDWAHLNDKFPWPPGVKDSPGEQFWGGLSNKYAKQLSGDVTTFQTADRAKTGGGYVFKTYELPEVVNGQASGRITSFKTEIVGP